MCGIWFSLGLTPDPARIDLVRHRGPDGRGWKVFDSSAGPVALGHRRLAIIDISDAALQPMTYGEGRYWIVYNGEIYNYLELRAELEAQAVRFRTNSDTEVLLAAYARWGEAALDRLVGMFAFVLWDAREQTVFAARDRFGIKPLYYLSTPHGVAFASEIKQLCGVSGYSGRMNLTRLRDFLSSGIMEHTSETLFDGVMQLRGGESVKLDLSRWRPGSALSIRRWYRILEPGTIKLTEAEAASRFRGLLSESVRIHLRSDVPIGSCLSGGLDSSSIVCLMARELDKSSNGARVNSVSACYEEKSVDERPFIDEVVAAAKCVPHYVYPKLADAFALAERITWHQDEPYGSTSIFAQWRVFEAARHAGIKVMMDGQGADEQLAGYHGSFGYYLSSLARQRRIVPLIRAMLERRVYHGVPFFGQAKDFLFPLLPPQIANRIRREARSIAQHNWMDSEAFSSIGVSQSAFDTAATLIGRGPVTDIGELCVVLTQASNLTMLLHWEDRNSMAHSIEARVPFLDHRLVEFTIALGDQHKIVGGDTKRVLRRGMSGILPDKITRRRDKLGFATPEEIWFRGPLRKAVESGVEETLARYPGLLNAGATRKLVFEMLDGARPLDFTVWRIINVGIWGRVFGLTA